MIEDVKQIILGTTDQHIVYLDQHLNTVLSREQAIFGINKQVVEPLMRFIEHAKSAGFELTIASAFRSFDRQLSIFNRKANGQLTIVDEHNDKVEIESMTQEQLLKAILHFSALPGTSRHHWGTDFDFYDKTLLPAGKTLELAPWEYQKDGYFYTLSQWLKANASSFGFYSPYDCYRGGVAQEPWHYSYFPLASSYQNALTLKTIVDQLSKSNISLKTKIIDNIDDIYHQYVINIAEPPHV